VPLSFLHLTLFTNNRANFVPVSGLTGANILREPENVFARWKNKPPSLLTAIDEFQPCQRQINKPLRILVTDVYTEGRGLKVCGRIVQGQLRLGESVCIMPVGEVAIAQRITNPATGEMASVTKDKNKRLVVSAGDNVEVFVSGVDPSRVSTGNVVCHSSEELRVPVHKKFMAKLMTYVGPCQASEAFEHPQPPPETL